MNREADKLTALLEIAPLLNDFMPEDIGVTITNREEVLAYYPGDKLVLKNDDGEVTKEGDPVNPNWVVNKAMETGERIVKEVEASVSGVPYIGVSNPIYNGEGEVVGGITISQATDKKEELLEVANDLLGATEKVNGQAEDISIEADKLVDTGDKLDDISRKTKEKIEDTDNITEIIKNISSRIKMIGINASIEAARVGEEGDGFSVVAQEIQELAEKSSNSISEIEETLNQVYESAKKLNTVVEEINESSNEQSKIIDNVYAEIQNLTALGNEIVKMGETLSNN